MNFVLQVADLRTKRPQRQFGHLERLDAKRNADDGNAVQQSGAHVAERHPHAGQHEPHDVDQHRSHATAVYHGLAERGQRQSRHFERLYAQWNADDGDAQHQSDDGPAGGQEQTAQKQLQNIAKKSHGNMVTNVGRYGQDFAVRSDRS